MKNFTSPRRECLATAARWATAATTAAMLGPLNARRSATAAEDVPSPTTTTPGAIDAHVHVWTPDLENYPLAPGFSRADMQPASFTAEQLFAHCRPHGVDRIVLIQMSYYGFDNRYMTDTIARFPGVFSGVAIVDEHAPQLAKTMAKLATQGVRGFRIHPADQSLETWIGSAGMQSLWAAAAEQGLAVCPLINPEALPLIDRMCRRYPQTRVVIDHFARIGIDGNPTDAQLDSLCRLAEHRQTYVKTSAFYALGQKRPPYTDLAPMIRRVRDAFGAERLMWASDCPFQVGPGHDYEQSIALIRDRLDFLTDDERKAMLRRTAEQVYF